MIGLRLLGVEEVEGAAPATQAAALRRSCGHVRGEPELIAERGFRFYPMPGQELPSFLNKRFDAAGETAAITLLAGIDPATGEAVLEAAATTDDALRLLARGPGGVWLLRLTLGNATLTWNDLTTGLLRGNPAGFAAIATELLELPLCSRRECRVCSRGPR